MEGEPELRSAGRASIPGGPGRGETDVGVSLPSETQLVSESSVGAGESFKRRQCVRAKQRDPDDQRTTLRGGGDGRRQRHRPSVVPAQPGALLTSLSEDALSS